MTPGNETDVEKGLIVEIIPTTPGNFRARAKKMGTPFPKNREIYFA
jgi:hypothetical protein